MKRLALLCSGRGSDIVNLLSWIELGFLPNYELTTVILDRTCPAVMLCTELALNFYLIPKVYIKDVLDNDKIDLVIMSGFMTILPEEVVYNYRVLNIHPSLLPNLPGRDPQQQALDQDYSVTGVTVHVADGGVDTGEILLQREVPVLLSDDIGTLCSRLQIVGSNLLLKQLLKEQHNG